MSYKVQLDDSYDDGYRHNHRSAEYYMENVCQKILDWIDCLKVDEVKPQQLSLFGEEEEEFEKLPPHPTKDSGWSKYHKECERITKANKIKKFTFLELADVKYYTYSGIDHRKSLPSTKEVRELLKSAIIKGTQEPGRYDDFWFDTPSYLYRDGAVEVHISIESVLSTYEYFDNPEYHSLSNYDRFISISSCKISR